MDNVRHLSEVQRREHSVQDLPPAGAGSTVIVQPEDLRELKLTDFDQVGRILSAYNEMDVPRDNVMAFTEQLTLRQDSWFVEAGELGLFYFTNIVPRLDATFNMIFWDKRLTGDRREVAKLAISAAFSLFALRRISSVVVESNIPLRKTLQKIGFMPEGIIRQSKRIGDVYHDAHTYGLLSEEITWPVLKTSLV